MVVMPVTDKTGRMPTHELWMRLFEAPSIERFLGDNGEACDMPTLPEYLLALCEERGVEPAQVARRAGVERSFGNRLFSGMRHPSRDTVLQLAFGFGLSADEAQELLKMARAAPLHPKIKRDAMIAYCLHKGLSLMDAQQMLYDYELPLLGGGRGA